MRNGERSRQRILEQVQKDPGVIKSALCRHLGLGWGTVSHHLRILAREGRIVSYGIGKEVRLFAGGLGETQARWLSVLGGGPAASIVDQLKERPGLRLAELSASIGVSRKVIRRHLAVLDEEGLIGHDGEVRPRYHLHLSNGFAAPPAHLLGSEE